MGSQLALGIQNIAQKTAILDTNLLVLAVSMRVGLHRLRSFDRIRNFAPEDAVLLATITNQFRDVATTAYVLAEVSNLANKLTGSLRKEWFQELASFTLITPEAQVATQILGGKSETIRFGIADSALSELAQKYVIITAETRLSGYLQKLGLDVLNFNHFRYLG